MHWHRRMLFSDINNLGQSSSCSPIIVYNNILIHHHMATLYSATDNSESYRIISKHRCTTIYEISLTEEGELANVLSNSYINVFVPKKHWVLTLRASRLYCIMTTEYVDSCLRVY